MPKLETALGYRKQNMWLVEGGKGHLIFFDYTVIFLAIILNILALVGTVKARFVLTNYRRYLISLVISNLLICLVNVCLFINHILVVFNETRGFSGFQNCIACFQRSSLLFAIFANLLTLIGMSIEHFIGIVSSLLNFLCLLNRNKTLTTNFFFKFQMHPLKYCTITEHPLSRWSIAWVWIIAFALGYGDIAISTIIYSILILSKGNGNESGQNEPSMPCSPFNLNDQMSTTESFLPQQISFSSSHNVNSASPTTIIRALRFSGMSSFTRPGPNWTTTEMTTIPDSKLLEMHEALIHSLLTSDEEYVFECLESKFKENRAGSSWCEMILKNKIWHESIGTAITLLSFFFLAFFYGRIIRQMLQRNRRIFREWIWNTVLLLGAFMICWLPYMILEFLAIIVAYHTNKYGPKSSRFSFSEDLLEVHNIFHSLYLMFPLLDPILHVTRVSAVKK